MMDRAEQMREAAVLALKSATGFDEDHPAVGAIRALPLPPAPPLADDVAGVVKWLRRSAMIGSDEAADLIERLVARAEKAEAEVARLREALTMLNDKALMNAGEFAKYVREVTTDALAPKGYDHE